MNCVIKGGEASVQNDLETYPFETEAAHEIVPVS